MTENSYLKIQDYALIGDGRSVALVGRNGSIDWLCWPRFDSASTFAGLLDRRQGGVWSIEPSHRYTSQRRYIEESNVLETTFVGEGGRAVLTDLMPVDSEENKARMLFPDHEIVRRLKCTAGEIDIAIRFCPRPDYGRSRLSFRAVGKLGYRAEYGRGVYWLRSSRAFDIHDGDLTASTRMKAGDVLEFSLTYSQEAPAVLPCLGEPLRARIDNTIRWWQDWAGRAKYDGPYRDVVVRSALALQALAYAPSGAIVAAATTSLPERLHDSLNWDYRFCWLRDASFTLRALVGLDYWDEAYSFLGWLLHSTRLTQPALRVLYTVYGGDRTSERELDYLEGYSGSRPVRVGNAARHQLQLDLYGEVIDAAAQYAFHGQRFDHETQKVLIGFGEYVAKNWRQPDEGIWEPRGGRKHNTHSRLLCWVALDRLITLARDAKLERAPLPLFEQECRKIIDDICNAAWNSELKTYTATVGGDDLDATLLLIPWYGFEKAESQRMRATYATVAKALRAGDSLLYRYLRTPPEGAFGLCSFWEVEYLALGGGSYEQARDLFERVIEYRNDVGLFAEEIDAESGDALGNFPQAFTHVGLIGAALALESRAEGQRQLPHREQEAGQ